MGGVSAGGRFNHALGGPLLLRRGWGSRVEDVNGRVYLDFHNAAGAALYGFNHPRLRRAVEHALTMGFFINFDTEFHAELAELICHTVPCAEKVRFCNSGTEATLAAIRVARHVTGKTLVLKFDGHFHGMHELIWFNHSKVAPRDSSGVVETVADSAGIPQSYANQVIVVEFNNPTAVETAFHRYGTDIAAVILEPISYNCGCMPAKPEFLRFLREKCTESGAILIFDEVLSGFRMCAGCAQEYFGVVPDLTTLAKALGGGFPIAALVGRREYMDALNPVGPVVMSGTYSGGLIPILAALECLRMLRENGFYEELNRKANELYREINRLFKHYGIPGHVRGIGARFGLFFGVENPEDDFVFHKIASSFDSQLHRAFVKECIKEGLYFLDVGPALTPTHFGITSAHSDSDLELAVEKLKVIFARLSRLVLKKEAK